MGLHALRSCGALVLFALLVCSPLGCKSPAQETAGNKPIADSDCLPNISLTDQRGGAINLSSLKGKPVLFDFIYTSCPGPCGMMTSKMTRIADLFGQGLGSKVNLISITVDPEHDGPSQLRSYAKEQNADRTGWLFLTGKPPQIEQVMSGFRLRRIRYPDGSIDHVLGFFLVGPDGRLQNEYLPTEVKPETVAGDADRLASQGN